MKILKTSVSVLLLVLMFFSLAVGLILAVPQSVMIDPVGLSERITDSAYCAQMYQNIYASLDTITGLTVFEASDLKEVLTEVTVRTESPKALQAAFSYMKDGGVLYSYQSETLLAEIETLLQTYAQDNHVEYNPDSAKEVYDMICECITAEMMVVPQTYMQTLSGPVQKIVKIVTWWFVPFVLFVLCSVGVLLLGRRRIFKTLYYLMIPTYFAPFTVFVAAFAVYKKDYLQKTVLGNTMLQSVLRSTFNVVLENLWQAALVVTIVAAVALIAVIVLLLYKRRGRQSM